MWGHTLRPAIYNFSDLWYTGIVEGGWLITMRAVTPQDRKTWLRAGLCTRCGLRPCRTNPPRRSCGPCGKRASDYYYRRGGYNPEQARLHRQRRREARIQYARENRVRQKLEVIGAYGGRCVCCGEQEPVFLCVDHIDEGRPEGPKKKVGGQLYTWLRDQGYPSGFQILCFNCNNAIRYGRVCPHQAQI